ncbi:MAG: hypothetical protein ABIF12_00375 [bacterium]
MTNNEFVFTKDFLDKKPKEIISFFEHKISGDFIQFFIDTYMAGEEIVAYECLCGHIYKKRVILPKKILLLIKEECLDWDLDSKYWKKLEDLMIN